jgi:mannose-6-phosphate isomerase-like protein (cupin superfamily)
MKQARLKFAKGFHVRIGNRRAQAAEMVLSPGESEGGADNRHRGADQWLFVLAGTGVARVNDRTYRLGAGTLMLIERGDRHQIRSTGRSLLRTLNIYVPPAYRPDGHPLPRGKKTD